MPIEFYLTLLCAGASASICDFAWRRIPNPLTLTAALAGLFLHFLHAGWWGLADGFLGLVLGLALLIPGYLTKMTGGGDVKLLGALGSLLGPSLTLYAFLVYVLVSLGWALLFNFYAWLTQGAGQPFGRYLRIWRQFLYGGEIRYEPPPPHEAMARRFPMAPAIALGAAAAPLLFSSLT